MSTELPAYEYRGARSLVSLHDRYLREFVGIWKRARAAEIELPRTPDPDYASLETLLLHVLGAARGYMTWICESLELEDPRIDEPPQLADVANEADAYLDHVLARWRTPLAGEPEDRFGPRAYTSRWGVLYCIDAMLEHAVMHPIRHTYQIAGLLDAHGRC